MQLLRSWVVRPARHGRPRDAVFNRVKELAVGQLLCTFGPHVRNARIRPAPNSRIATAVVGMTQGAMVGPMFAGRLQHLWGALDGIGRIARAGRVLASMGYDAGASVFFSSPVFT